MNAEEAERKRVQGEVKAYCNHLLETAGVRNVYPTPIDKIVEAAELVKSCDLSLLEFKGEVFPQSIWRRFKSSLSDLISLVKAGLFPKEKTIFINPNTPGASVPFATLHECVHSILPWQQKTLIYLDDKKSLDSQTRYQFEREANFGGSYLLWQGEDYIKKSLDMPITTATPVFLANLYGGSIHSSMRYYVENHQAALGLFIFKINSIASEIVDRYQLQYFVASQSFKNQFTSRSFSLGKADISDLLMRATATARGKLGCLPDHQRRKTETHYSDPNTAEQKERGVIRFGGT